MQELPLALLFAEQVGHAQAHSGGLLLADDAYRAALDRDRVGQVAAHTAREILKLHRGAALLEARGGPVIAQRHFAPALLVVAPGAHDRAVGLVRGVALPERRVAVEEALDTLLEAWQELSESLHGASLPPPAAGATGRGRDCAHTLASPWHTAAPCTHSSSLSRARSSSTRRWQTGLARHCAEKAYGLQTTGSARSATSSPRGAMKSSTPRGWCSHQASSTSTIIPKKVSIAIRWRQRRSRKGSPRCCSA